MKVELTTRELQTLTRSLNSSLYLVKMENINRGKEIMDETAVHINELLEYVFFNLTLALNKEVDN